jgi:plasmid stabilization system protein ParE
MSFRFHPEAEAEFVAAVDWYEARSTGLGADFAVEIHAAIQRAAAMPEAWPRVGGDIRREPDYWRKRL